VSTAASRRGAQTSYDAGFCQLRGAGVSPH